LVSNAFRSQIRRKRAWMKLYLVQRNHIKIQILLQESTWREAHMISHWHSLTIMSYNRKKIPITLHDTMAITKCNAHQSLPSSVKWFLYSYLETKNMAITNRTWKRVMATNLNVLLKLVDNSNLKMMLATSYGD
jgi:hypothetical protein